MSEKDHDDIADGLLEEAMCQEQQAKAAVGEMAALLDAPSKDGRVDEEKAAKLAGDFVASIKGLNDNVTEAEWYREKAAEEAGD